MGIFKNWKTTLAGLGTLALVAYHGYANPATLADPGSAAQVLTGIGLLLAHDAKKDPQPPPVEQAMASKQQDPAK